MGEGRQVSNVERRNWGKGKAQTPLSSPMITESARAGRFISATNVLNATYHLLIRVAENFLYALSL